MKRNTLIFSILAIFIIINVLIYKFVYLNKYTIPETIDNPKQFQLSTKVETFKTTNASKSMVTETSNSATTSDLDYDDLLLLQNKQKEIRAKITLLAINTNLKTSIDETCNFEDTKERIDCKKDLFLGCGDSLYLGLEMASECEQFSADDYLKFIEIKKQQEDEKIKSSGVIQTDFGEIHIIDNGYTNKSDPDLKNAINSGSINTDKEVKKIDEILEERKIVEPEKAESNYTTIKSNTNAYSNFYGWVTGWGTLFAINGGKREAGQIMNQYTAFGYNPYISSTCIVSLPYKTVDRFFGTSLDYCVKTKNIACINKVKSLIKNRAIEVVMLKNGKHAVLPLGDFGPAEWTGNAIDFTACARNILGATGKDLIKFRPLP